MIINDYFFNNLVPEIIASDLHERKYPLPVNEYWAMGMVFSLWNKTQQELHTHVSRADVGVYVGINLSSIYHAKKREMALNIVVDVLTKNKIIKPSQDNPDVFEIVGNDSRIEAINKNREKVRQYKKRKKEQDKEQKLPSNLPCNPTSDDTGEGTMLILNSKLNRKEEYTSSSVEPDSISSTTIKLRKRKDLTNEVTEFVNIWNDNRGSLAECTRLTQKRSVKIKARLSECPDLGYWEYVVQRLAASTFATTNSWATIDWLIKNDENHVKVDEGNYDDQKGKPRMTAMDEFLQHCVVEKN